MREMEEKGRQKEATRGPAAPPDRALRDARGGSPSAPEESRGARRARPLNALPEHLRRVVHGDDLGGREPGPEGLGCIAHAFAEDNDRGGVLRSQRILDESISFADRVVARVKGDPVHLERFLAPDLATRISIIPVQEQRYEASSCGIPPSEGRRFALRMSARVSLASTPGPPKRLARKEPSWCESRVTSLSAQS